MLDELLDFENVSKIPPKIKQYSTYLKKTKSNSRAESYKSDLKKLSSQKKITILEKINYRKKKEEEEKRKALFNNLQKNKKMNLRQFLSRMQNYEQRRKYNLELKKYEKLREETSYLREKPKINNTLKFNEKIPKEPLYKRTEEVIDERKKMIENLTIFYTLPKEIQKQKNIMRNRYKIKYYSAENTKNDFDDNDNNNTIKSFSIENLLNKKKNQKGNHKKMTKQKSDEFYNKQEEWYKNKKAKEQYYEQLIQKQQNTYSDITFHPYINQVTLEILDIKNNINTNNEEFYKYNINRSQYDDFDVNKGRTIFDKLYEDSFKKNYNKPDYILNSINYEDNYNYTLYQIKKRDKYKNILPKYLDIYKNDNNKNNKRMNKTINFDIKLKKRNLKENKSYDDINTMNSINNNYNDFNNRINSRNLKSNKPQKPYINNINNNEEKYKRHEEIDNYQWKNTLLSIKSDKRKYNDYTYHINVRQKGAWDSNFLNQIKLDKNANTRSIINDIISN